MLGRSPEGMPMTVPVACGVSLASVAAIMPIAGGVAVTANASVSSVVLRPPDAIRPTWPAKASATSETYIWHVVVAIATAPRVSTPSEAATDPLDPDAAADEKPSAPSIAESAPDELEDEVAAKLSLASNANITAVPTMPPWKVAVSPDSFARTVPIATTDTYIVETSGACVDATKPEATVDDVATKKSPASVEASVPDDRTKPIVDTVSDASVVAKGPKTLAEA